MMRRKRAPSAITCGSVGTNAATSGSANANASTPAAVIVPNAIQAPTVVVCRARSRCPAPTFCPTTVDVAIPSPSAGMRTNEKIRVPTPYAATASLPNPATSVTSTVSPRARMA